MNYQINMPVFQISPLKAFQIMDEKKLKDLQKKIEKQEDEAEDDKKGRAILCKYCRNKITNSANRFEMNGRHKHVFNNPGGYIFEIGCFSAAPGCMNHGPPTLEFTWFSGFSWQFAACSKCSLHLGWLYISTFGQTSFYGLILDNLIEEIIDE